MSDCRNRKNRRLGTFTYLGMCMSKRHGEKPSKNVMVNVLLKVAVWGILI